LFFGAEITAAPSYSNLQENNTTATQCGQLPILLPRPLSEEIWLKSHDDPRNKSRFYVLKRSSGEENCNPYNAHLLKAWKANMDILLIGSVYGTAAYVCSYMFKSESKLFEMH